MFYSGTFTREEEDPPGCIISGHNLNKIGHADKTVLMKELDTVLNHL